MKLKPKLFFLIASISLVIILVFGGFIYHKLWNERLSQISDSIAQQARNFDFSLKTLFTAVEGDVRTLVDNEEVRYRDDSDFTSFLEADEKTFEYDYSEQEQRIIDIFNTYRLSHRYVSSVYMGRENGTFVRSHPRERPTSYDPRDRPWYVLAKTNPTKVVETDAYPSVTTDDVNIGVVKALIDENDAVYGVVGIDLTLSDLTEYILSFKIRPTGRIFLVDRKGTVLASQEKLLRGETIGKYSQELASILENGEKGISPLRLSGKSYFLFHNNSSVKDWEIAVLIPAENIEREVRGSVLWVVVSLTVGMSLLSAFILYGFHLFVINPLKKLTGETEIIARTENLDRHIDISTRDEIADLANSFNVMIGTLGQSRNALKATEKNLIEYKDRLEELVMQRTSELKSTLDELAERIETEKAVKTAYRQLEDILELLPDATFVIDQNKKVIAWNRACETLTGVKKEQIIGLGDNCYSYAFWGDRRNLLVDLLDVSSEEMEAVYKYVKHVDDTVVSESFIEELNGRKNVHLWGVAAPLCDRDGERWGAIEVVRDVTEIKHAEVKLTESERKFRELVEHANSIILHWTHEGLVTFLNPYGQRFFGYTSDEIIGKHVIGTIVPSLDSEGHDLNSMIEQICDDPQSFEQNVNENVRRNGERVWVAWTNRIVRDLDGKVVEIQSVGTDITELKHAEEAIRELNIGLERRVIERTEELAVAKERAEEADRLKSAFLATMSHELRTPLNSIIGFTGIILQGLAGPLTDEQRKQLEMVRDSAKHLLSLINDVLDISKIEAGQLKVNIEPFNLRASVEKTVGIVRPLAEKKNLELLVRFSPDVEEFVSDPRRVEQVLLNLLNNAIKFTDKGSVAVNVELTSLQHNTSEPAVRISVKDTGIGIKPDDLAILFQPFRQIDTGLTRKHEGTGLGLAICRRLAELLGGDIEASSEWGTGSVFTFTLPHKRKVCLEEESASH